MPDGPGHAKKLPVIGTALLIAGAAVGAGILGLPIQTGLAGFGPALVGQLAMAGALLATAWVLAEALIRRRGRERDLAWLYQQELGRGGRWMLIIGYLVNLYGIMVAYLAGAATVLGSLLGRPEWQGTLLLAFFVPATALVLFGLPVVRRGNALLIVLLVGSLLYLLWHAAGGVQVSHLSYRDWSFFPATLPIIMCTLAFHNMVPLICRSLDMQPAPVRRALGIGVAITLVVALVLTLMVVAVLPLQGSSSSLLAAYQDDLPATIPLARHLGSPSILAAGLLFAICAILTSYITLSSALLNFWTDILPPAVANRWYRAGITFLPPLVVVYVYPDLFLKALDVAGGLGIAVIYGVGPAVMLLRRRGGAGWVRMAGVALLVVFGVVVLLELAQELGWLAIRPEVEHWTSYQHLPAR